MLRTDQDGYRDELVEHLSVILGHLVFVASLALMVSPVVAFALGFRQVAAVLTLAVLLTSPATITALKHYREFNFKRCWNSLLFIWADRVVKTLLVTIVNLIVFARFGLATMIPLLGLIGMYVLTVAVVPFLYRKGGIKRRFFLSITLVPAVINVLLVINYLPSSNPVKETYMIHWNWQTVKGSGATGVKQRSSCISLSGEAYRYYPGIRMFWDFDQIKYSRKITYTFETGLLGLRVMKSYEFW